MKFNLILSCFVAILADTERVDRHVFAGTFFSNRVMVYFD